MNLILKKWSIFRILRLIMGVLVIIQAIQTKDILFGLAGIIFTLMPLFNLGCCGVNNTCSSTLSIKNKSIEKEIEYEEVV